MTVKDLGGMDIRCKDCGKRLMSICNITNIGPDTIPHFVKATCPFCGAESDWHEINGIFKFGPIPDVGPDGMPNNNSTVIANVEKIDDTHTLFHIIKRNK